VDGQSVIVLDTHVLVWWVDGERKKLSRKAAQALQQHGRRNELLVSATLSPAIPQTG
jgi:PIN domain nuclease of toxin-antitoxin system